RHVRSGGPGSVDSIPGLTSVLPQTGQASVEMPAARAAARVRDLAVCSDARWIMRAFAWSGISCVMSVILPALSVPARESSGGRGHRRPEMVGYRSVLTWPPNSTESGLLVVRDPSGPPTSSDGAPR